MAFALASRMPFIENLTWFEYRDDCADPAIADCQFGLVRNDFSRRPAFDVLREVTAEPPYACAAASAQLTCRAKTPR